jgi:hypothetical protein
MIDGKNFSIELSNNKLVVNGTEIDSTTAAKYKALLKDGQQELKIEVKEK